MIRALDDAEAAAREAAEEVAFRAAAAVEARSRFAVALAGGHTPRRMYELLGTELAGSVPWDRVHVFWGDERCVPPDHPDSNYRMARETLLDAVPIPAASIHRIRGELEPDDAAAEYDWLLANFFGSAEPLAAFDLVLLGVGPDGHTASLFPGQVEPDDSRWARAVRAPEGVEPPDRVTLTLRALNASAAAVFLVTGAAKRPVVSAVREEAARDRAPRSGRSHAGQPAALTGRGAGSEPAPSSGLPAVLIRPPGGALWIVDRAAAG